MSGLDTVKKRRKALDTQATDDDYKCWFRDFGWTEFTRIATWEFGLLHYKGVGNHYRRIILSSVLKAYETTALPSGIRPTPIFGMRILPFQNTWTAFNIQTREAAEQWPFDSAQPLMIRLDYAPLAYMTHISIFENWYEYQRDLTQQVHHVKTGRLSASSAQPTEHERLASFFFPPSAWSPAVPRAAVDRRDCGHRREAGSEYCAVCAVFGR